MVAATITILLRCCQYKSSTGNTKYSPIITNCGFLPILSHWPQPFQPFLVGRPEKWRNHHPAGAPPHSTCHQRSLAGASAAGCPSGARGGNGGAGGAGGGSRSPGCGRCQGTSSTSSTRGTRGTRDPGGARGGWGGWGGWFFEARDGSNIPSRGSARSGTAGGPACWGWFSGGETCLAAAQRCCGGAAGSTGHVGTSVSALRELRSGLGRTFRRVPSGRGAQQRAFHEIFVSWTASAFQLSMAFCVFHMWTFLRKTTSNLSEANNDHRTWKTRLQQPQMESSADCWLHLCFCSGSSLRLWWSPGFLAILQR